MGQLYKYRDSAEYSDGIADFEDLRQRNCIYVDKTAFVYKIAKKKYVFLNRPRRFGKSLLCSTLKCYFEGKKELFDGLAISGLEKNWEKYPVLHISISALKDKPVDQMANTLLARIHDYEKIYGKHLPEEVTPGARFYGVIKRAFGITGKKVVIIIDEYDAPMLTYMHDEAKRDTVRNIMQEFYQTIKGCEEYEKFVFITGITKFSLLSIFSTINNLSNISMDDAYGSLCGITESELHEVFDPDVQMLADKMGICKEEMYVKLKAMYDGYHFCDDSVNLYNPYSIIRSFSHCKLDTYWFASGTPTFLIDELKKNCTDILKYDGAIARSTEFDQPTEEMDSPLPLMYQAGYLTIKEYNPISNSYVLGIPNSEVRSGLMDNILPIITGTKRSDNSSYATQVIDCLTEEKYDQAMKWLQSFLASIPYMQQGKDYLKDLATLEAFYQRDLYIFFCGMSATVQCEAMMSEGRTDMVMYLGDKIYVFEFKVSASAKSALDQIDKNKYYEPWRATQRTIIKCGVKFDVATRTLKDWKFEEVK